MENKELKHVGVLGMKWGHGRGGSESGSSSRRSGNVPKLSRKEKRYQKDTAIASVRRAQTKTFLKEMLKANKGQSKEKQRKEREFWKEFLKDDLNATPESISKERRQTGKTLAAAGLLVVGGVALNTIFNSYK